MSRDENVAAIIGGGIIGVCCALYLQEKGFRVQLIDRAGGDDKRASFGNAGNLSPWSCVPESVPGLWKSVPGWLLDPMGPMALRLSHLPWATPWLLRFLSSGRLERVEQQADALRSLYAPVIDLYEDLLRPIGQTELIRRCRYVALYRDAGKADLNALGWRLRRDRGAELQVIPASDLRDLEPDLSHDYQAAILLQGQGRTTNPQHLLEVLTARMLRQGGTVIRADVSALRPDAEGVELQTSDGPLRFRRIVVAAGAWSAPLLKSMGIRVPLETERGYHLTIRDPGVTINNTLMEADRMVVASTMQEGLRLAGTVELAGLKPAPDYRRARMLATLGREMFPKLRLGEASEWMGHRPSLPDSLPVIGHAPGHPNVLLAFGHSHLGLSGGAPTGKLIAGLAAGEPPSIDLTPFRVDRF